MAPASKTDPSPKFGTFGGVFVPNILTILGVILFLRTGWVVGQTGLPRALLILVIANSITLLTSLSLSAIATNTKVGGGGVYYLISRSLGLEIGGSIGVPLYFAQALSVTFYTIGFTESLLSFFPHLNVPLVATVVLALLFAITWVGSDWAVKAQYVIFFVLTLSLLSFFAGGSFGNHLNQNLTVAFTGDFNFWKVFAIFFPAVTGIMAGVSMSGNLKNPSRAIPIGTIGAVLLTFLIYAAHMYWLAQNAEREELLNNYMIMGDIALVPGLIYLGLWAATLSSALASLLAAPRTLQALAYDGVVPRFISRRSGSKKEPRLALGISFMLAQTCIMIGELDLIASLISMFFLATYGTINLVAALEHWVANPSFRPTLKIPWILSLIGGVGCVSVMFLLHATATVVAIFSILTLYLILTNRRYRTAWGDMRSGFWFSVTRFGLLRFSDSRQHIRNWRPVILALIGSPKRHRPLIEFANWLECRCGFLFLAQILTGEWGKIHPRAEAAHQSMDEFIKERAISGTARVITADSFEKGVTNLLQVSGIGPLRPNTVLIGWSEDAIKIVLFRNTIRRILKLKINLLLFIDAQENLVEQLEPYIDVWWLAKQNGTLMITLAHLLCSNSAWRRHTIRVRMIITNEEGAGEARENLQQRLKDARIDAKVDIIVSSDPPLSVISRESKNVSVCFLGMSVQALKDYENPLQEWEPIAETLNGNVFITKNWQDIEL